MENFASEYSKEQLEEMKSVSNLLKEKHEKTKRIRFIFGLILILLPVFIYNYLDIKDYLINYIFIMSIFLGFSIGFYLIVPIYLAEKSFIDSEIEFSENNELYLAKHKKYPKLAIAINSFFLTLLITYLLIFIVAYFENELVYNDKNYFGETKIIKYEPSENFIDKNIYNILILFFVTYIFDYFILNRRNNI